MVSALHVFFMMKVKERGRLELTVSRYYQWAEPSLLQRDLVYKDLITINDCCTVNET